jgi:hypothetical protein
LIFVFFDFDSILDLEDQRPKIKDLSLNPKSKIQNPKSMGCFTFAELKLK